MDYGVVLKQQYPNPSRRSSHHVKQSRFEGSNRQLRSRMLRAVLECPGITMKKLAKVLETGHEILEKNLITLEREGFLELKQNGYRVRSETQKG